MNKKVQYIIEDKLGLSSDSYTEDSNFVTDLGCDSLDMLDITLELEKEFEIFIPDEVVDDLSTPRKLSDYIEENIKKK